MIIRSVIVSALIAACGGCARTAERPDASASARRLELTKPVRAGLRAYVDTAMRKMYRVNHRMVWATGRMRNQVTGESSEMFFLFAIDDKLVKRAHKALADAHVLCDTSLDDVEPLNEDQ